MQSASCDEAPHLLDLRGPSVLEIRPATGLGLRPTVEEEKHILDKKSIRAGAVCFLMFMVGAFALMWASTKMPHSEASWAIQGEYSHLDCDSQPGTHPWYVESEGHQFFMGCR
jgi:hypothetical protein